MRLNFKINGIEEKFFLQMANEGLKFKPMKQKEFSHKIKKAIYLSISDPFAPYQKALISLESW